MNDGLTLKGITAIVTGARQGIGAGVAIGFAHRGANVALWDIAAEQEAEKTLDAVRDHCRQAIYLAVDVADEQQVISAAEQTLDRMGEVTVLVNNAGIYPRKPFLEMNHDEWRRVVDVNLTRAWLCSRAIAPRMAKRGYGKIINVSSIQFLLGSPGLPHYVASKGGILGLTRAMARDLGPHGIRVNAVMPGAILTEGELRDFPDQAEVLRLLNERQCISGRIYPKDIEPTFAFLASPASDAITGQAINVDHGWVHW